MKDYKKLTRKELINEFNNNQDILLKSKKMFRKLDASVFACTGISALGLFTFAVSSNPILKLTGLGLSFIGAIPGILVVGSNKYKTAKIEYETAIKIQEEINEAIEELNMGE